MENPINMDDLGGKPPIFGNIHLFIFFGSWEFSHTTFEQVLGVVRWCRVMSGCVFLAIQPFRWVETSRRATYSTWFDGWRHRKMPVSHVFFFSVFGKREKTIPPDVPESWIHTTLLHHITNICQKRIPDHMLRLNRILTHPFQFFLGADAWVFGCEVFWVSLGREGECRVVRSWIPVSLHSTGAISYRFLCFISPDRCPCPDTYNCLCNMNT